MLATDLEVGLRSKFTASISKGGSLTLPAKKLYEIIKALPETDVRIEEDKGGVKVAADRFDSRMQTLPREDFPIAAGRDRHLQRDVGSRRPSADGLEDAVCDHRRGHALLPQRGAVHPAGRIDEPGVDRRPSAGAHHRAARKGEAEGRRRGSSDPAAQDAARTRSVADRG